MHLSARNPSLELYHLNEGHSDRGEPQSSFTTSVTSKYHNSRWQHGLLYPTKRAYILGALTLSPIGVDGTNGAQKVPNKAIYFSLCTLSKS